MLLKKHELTSETLQNKIEEEYEDLEIQSNFWAGYYEPEVLKDILGSTMLKVRHFIYMNLADGLFAVSLEEKEDTDGQGSKYMFYLEYMDEITKDIIQEQVNEVKWELSQLEMLAGLSKEEVQE